MRPREDDLPLALVGLVVDLLELSALLQRDAGGQIELGELVTDSEHALSLLQRKSLLGSFLGGWTDVDGGTGCIDYGNS